MKGIMRNVIFALALAVSAQLAIAEDRSTNTIVLDETGVKNLRIETVVVEETEFEESIFSLGRIAANPGKIAAVTSRVPGRIVELKVVPGDNVESSSIVAKIESRQPGNPPPTISLEAPISGLVTKLDVRLGDPVEPDKSLLELTDLSEVYAVARVPEHYAGRMKPGAHAHIKVSAVPDGKFVGKLLRFGTSADVESGTLDAIFVLQNEEGLLRSEMRAEFSIVLNTRQNVMSVPRNALQGDAANRFVYVKDFALKNAFIKTPVVVGQMNDRAVEITSGLFPADEVVTRGAYSLAFAGGGSISLKEALDAAHGHEHAADGSELPEGDKGGGEAAHKEGDGHNHAEGAKGAPEHSGDSAAPAAQSPFWMIVSGVLFVLLIVTNIFSRKRGAHAEEAEEITSPKHNHTEA